MIFAEGISTGILVFILGQMLFHLWRKAQTAKARTMEVLEADRALERQRWWKRRWLRRIAYWSTLVLASLVAYGLYASFALAAPTLHHIDPVVFAALQLAVVLPGALVALIFTHGAGRACARLGLIGGIPLGFGFVCIALSLRSIGIVNTAMLTALDGVMASFIAWLVLHRRPSLYTCVAVACAGGGALLLWGMAPSRWQSDLVALLTGLLFTLYAFYVERHALVKGSLRQETVPFLAGVMVSMAGIALTLALCFGRWETLQAATQTDWGMIVYAGMCTVFLPLVISTMLLRFVGAVTWAFLAVLEPVISLLFAYLLRAISLGLFGWGGVGLILLSILLQANAGRPQATRQAEPEVVSEPEPAPASVAQ